MIFRTVPDGEAYRDALETTCAFEIDHRSTSSTVKAGACWPSVAAPRQRRSSGRLRFSKIPEPWAAGPRMFVVRRPCEQVTGRR